MPKAPGRHPNRLAGPIDDYVTDLVLSRLARADAEELLVDHDRPDVPALRQEGSALRARLDGLARDFAMQHEVSLTEYSTMTRSLRDRLAAIEAELADAGRVSVLGDLVRADDVHEAWAGLDLHRRRAVIRELVDIRVDLVGHGVRTFRLESVRVTWLAGEQG
jgi:hypothetical protein